MGPCVPSLSRDALRNFGNDAQGTFKLKRIVGFLSQDAYSRERYSSHAGGRNFVFSCFIVVACGSSMLTAPQDRPGGLESLVSGHRGVFQIFSRGWSEISSELRPSLCFLADMDQCLRITAGARLLAQWETANPPPLSWKTSRLPVRLATRLSIEVSTEP